MSKGKHKHQFQITILSTSAKEIKNKLEVSFDKEISEWREQFIEYLSQRNPSLIDDIIKFTDEDLIDWKSKGKDISKEEFLRNEIDFEREKYK